MLGSTAMPLAPETLGEQHPHLRGEGIQISFDVYRGATVPADKAEQALERLYEHIERLTEAHGSEE